MTGQLDRVRAVLAAGNVPCEMKRGPWGGEVLAAGTPTSSRWDVLVWEEESELWAQHRGVTGRLRSGGTDEAVADAIKLRVVQSWADQGDPQARALLSAIGDRYTEPAAGDHGSARRTDVRPSGPARSPQPAIRSVTAQISPWGFALRITDTEPGDSIPTSWAWQWGLGSNPVTDYYQRFFATLRSSATGAANEKP